MRKILSVLIICLVGCSQNATTQTQTLVEPSNGFKVEQTQETIKKNVLTKEHIDFIERGVCKVIAKGIENGREVIGMGTGFFYKELENSYLIMTNAHVVMSRSSFSIEIYTDGHRTKTIPVRLLGTFFKEGTSSDLAILSIDKNLIPGLHVSILDIDSNSVLQSDDLLFGWGFPDGKDACFWSSRVITNNQHIIEGTFRNIEGQSGGPVLSLIDDEPKVVGVVTWRLQKYNTEIGGNIASNHIISILTNGNKTTTSYLTVPFKMISKSSEKCEVCGLTKEDHYTRPGKDEYFCPTSIHVQCGPNGCYPPQYNYGNQPYIRRGGGINFGIGGGSEIYPQQPYPQQPYSQQPYPQQQNPNVNPSEDIWLTRPKSETNPNQNTGQKNVDYIAELENMKVENNNLLQKNEELAKSSHWLKEKFGDKSWLAELAILGVSIFTGGFTIPTLLARLGMKPLFAKLIGVAVQRRIKRVRKVKPDIYEDEYEDEDEYEYEDLTDVVDKIRPIPSVKKK